MRQAQSKPLLEALHDWMLQQRRRLSSKSTLGKALQYVLNRWEALTRYIEDGRLSINNNLSERLLRGIGVTRKNFLFVGSDAGGQRAAIIYTIAETAKLNSLDPEAYIAAVLDRMAHGHPISRLDELLPWNFKVQCQPCEWADAYVEEVIDLRVNCEVGPTVGMDRNPRHSEISGTEPVYPPLPCGVVYVPRAARRCSRIVFCTHRRARRWPAAM